MTSRIGILIHLIMLKLRKAQFGPFQSDFVMKKEKLLRLNIVLLFAVLIFSAWFNAWVPVSVYKQMLFLFHYIFIYEYGPTR